ncbi:MAG: TonB-dependent receptor [Deltaproteobacteria bacterium]|nr:TonB-dependent receptor [Deltaproteobacteria bacterium]
MKKKILLSVTALLTLSCPAHPLLAADQPPTESELTALYFDSEDTEQTTTRAPKLLSQVAENVTIVTADEIAAMRAHTLAEVLERQPGVFTSFATHDFLSDDFEPLLGASEHHTLVLLDGVRVNLNSGGDARTNFIPLTIIKRIEIIKGAASAAWGSALGGVINIITKDGGKSPVPTGSVSASYGEGRSRDVAADMAGQAAGVE